jgi:RNA polymerase sigma-70 factor (ECF subfamily)
VRLQSLRTRADPASATADAASDAELLRAVADGSDRAFEELRHRYQTAVQRICRSILRGSAEDCAQEAFVRIWQKARLFDSRRGSAAAWLLTLTRNVAYNLRAKKEPEPLELVPTDAQADDAALSVDGFWLDAGLARLPPHQRQVIELAYFADLSQTQIADRLGLPLGTVKSWTRRGLNHLATLLGEETSE